MNEWTTVYVNARGDATVNDDDLTDVEADRTMANEWWRNILDLPDLVVVESLRSPAEQSVRFVIRVRKS